MKQSKLMRRSAGSEAGFTLIELMIVVAIIGILAAIAIPNFLRAMNSAKYTNCVQSISGLKVAEEMYITDNTSYSPAGTNPAGMARLAMYMMPGCTAENDTSATCGGGLWTRLSKNCSSIQIYNLASGYDYEIQAIAKDRMTCHVCVSPKGFKPETYKLCSGTYKTAWTCP